MFPRPLRHNVLIAMIIVSPLSTGAVFAADLPAGKIRWETRWLWNDLNEGIALADINRDGQLDVIAGTRWFDAPDFKPHPVRDLEVSYEEFFTSNGDHVFDVNGDGWVDVIAGSWFSDRIHWYENPGKEGLAAGRKWTEHLIVEGQPSCEGLLFADIDGDAIPEIVVTSWAPDRAQTIVRITPGADGRPPKFRSVHIGGPGTGHGAGLGDINGDGRCDLLVCKGWYEQPAGAWYDQKWKFHESFNFTAISLPCLIVDLTGDGRNDLVVGQGHNYGVRWFEQQATGGSEITWTEHPIDDRYSQFHCLAWADLDGDGHDELVTGKRWRPHKGADPGSAYPTCLFRYVWDPAARTFERDVISYDRGVSTGMQIRVADLDADRRPDIAVAGKTGTYILFNRGPAPAPQAR